MDLVGALRPESRITDADLEQRRALIAIVSGHYSSFLRRNGNGHEARAPTWTWRRRHHPHHRTRSQVKPFFNRNVFNRNLSIHGQHVPVFENNYFVQLMCYYIWIVKKELIIISPFEQG